MNDELRTGLGGGIEGDANAVGNKDTNITHNAESAENSQRNSVSVSIQNRDRLELIDYKLTR